MLFGCILFLLWYLVRNDSTTLTEGGAESTKVDQLESRINKNVGEKII